MVSTLNLPPNVGAIGPQTELFGAGLELDSFNIVELVFALEEELGFEFSEDDFLEEHFQSVESLAVLIEGYINRPLGR